MCAMKGPEGSLPPSRPRERPSDLTRASSDERSQSGILDHFKQLTPTSGEKKGPRVRLEVIDSESGGVRHVSPRTPVAKGRVEVTDGDGVGSVRHFLAKLYEKGKKVVQKSEDIFGSLDNSVINLGPDDSVLTHVPIRQRSGNSRSPSISKSLDEYPVQGKIRIISNGPVENGGFCEVFQGKLRRRGQKDEELVAMKRLLVSSTPERERKLFRRETNAWNKLRHPNVLPFYGTVFHRNHIFMVSPWAHNGHIIAYLKNNPTANRRALLVQIAEALSYIHNDCKMIHGDVKGPNILISSKGNVLVADFGLASHIEKLPGVTATGKTIGTMMSPRFSAPELIAAAMDATDGNENMISPVKSRATDVYAFGMVILQVYTLERPWGELNTQRVYAQVMQGNKPKKPEGEAIARGLTPFLWMLVERCLEKDPADRPSMAALAVSLANGSLPAGAADLSGEIIGQHRESNLLVAKRRIGNRGEQVVLKEPKKGNNLQVQKIIQREIQALSSIKHPNILPFYGTAEIGSHLFIVTPWMENGNINSYITNHPRVDRLRLLYQVSDALSYLHSGPVATIGPMAHGSLQPESILVSSSGVVKLTDFGLSNLLEDLELTCTTDAPVDGISVRFSPPESFSLDHYSTAAPESDVYAFAMVMLQILTDSIPYADVSSSFSVINRIIKGKFPERPRTAAVDDSLWNLMTECWSYKPEDRPSMEEVRSRLAKVGGMKLESSLNEQQLANVYLPSVLDVDD